MNVAIKRKLKISERVATQQAKSTIKGSVVLALVELITNSDDSYRRLEAKGIKTDGKIVITITRRHKNSEIEVRDFAEGFDDERMNKCIGIYGDDTSGFGTNISGRGYWGRGLKEAMIALGKGLVRSIIDNKYYSCELASLKYIQVEPVDVSEKIRKETKILFGNGTNIQLIITNQDIRIPQYDTLKYQLTNYYSLRDILSNKNRKVILIEKKTQKRGNTKEELRYNFPLGTLYKNVEIKLPSYAKANLKLELYKATEKLSGREDEGLFRQSGVLIRSKGAIFDITMGSYEGNTYASKLFGHATCDYIDYLLRKDKEPLIQSNRTGLDWSHEFCREIRNLLDNEIKQFIKEEEKISQQEARSLANEKTKKRYESSLSKLNKIASNELGKGPGPGPGPESKIPENGFSFIPEYVQVIANQESSLYLKAIVPDSIPNQSIAIVTSDNKMIEVLVEKAQFEEADSDENRVVTKVIKVCGKRVGEEGVITAQIDNKKAEVLVKVISIRKPSERTTRERRKGGGIFNGFDFDPNADPNQRVKFNRTNGKIIIATKAPSVEIYFGPNGDGQEESHCQVMLAELVVDAVCREIARRKIETGQEPFLGEQSEAINAIHNRLINKYAAKIHALLVEGSFRRR